MSTHIAQKINFKLQYYPLLQKSCEYPLVGGCKVEFTKIYLKLCSCDRSLLTPVSQKMFFDYLQGHRSTRTKGGDPPALEE